jgi:hypothetical protein
MNNLFLFSEFAPPLADADHHNLANIIQINPCALNPEVWSVISLAITGNTA